MREGRRGCGGLHGAAPLHALHHRHLLVQQVVKQQDLVLQLQARVVRPEKVRVLLFQFLRVTVFTNQQLHSTAAQRAPLSPFVLLTDTPWSVLQRQVVLVGDQLRVRSCENMHDWNANLCMQMLCQPTEDA